ncbi:BlaI/MecI/CopY family transcriptional regulator [Planctomicrobium sp.]|nr:BlaI/MecI/CopY family transcriptional regulator [Planctomicrobium sp.]MDB4733426.1 BlaI/MecI/CopY family transcriptional regulator [Planctomicrobium sp.]MDB4743923.1 BlaI/MecI/CopY family transcriptional regulator [Planctomicrobium sp.]
MSENQLTKCELELMDIVWERRRVTVQEVADGLQRSLAYTTVMSTMNTLETKGAVRRCGKSGRAIIYEAIVAKEDVQQAMTDSLAKSLYGGSVKALMMSLIGNEQMSSEDINELRGAIEQLETNQ